MTDVDSHPLGRLEPVALIAVGGFAGSNLRYLAGFVLPDLAATLAVNALGSFVLGVVLYEAINAGVLAPETRTLLATGVLSSFTTYSTFAVQTAQAEPIWLVLNVVANYALGFAGVLAGRAVVGALDGWWS